LYNILFRLDGELLFFTCPKKSNQKKGIPGARASHTLSHLHCQRVVLTRHPGSTRLDWPSLVNRPYQWSCLRRAWREGSLPHEVCRSIRLW